MTAEEFLRESGIIKRGYSDWLVTFEDGRKTSIVELMEQYHEAKTKAVKDIAFGKGSAQERMVDIKELLQE